MAVPSDQPGWRPDPEQPGMVRWWNGLGWSDARRRADETMDRVRDAARDAVRGSTITPQQVARTVADRRAPRAVPGAAGAAGATGGNGLAVAALALGLLGSVFGADGVLPLIGLVVALAALARSRGLARRGRSGTGLGPSLAGLLLSAFSLIHWIPVVLRDLPGLLQQLQSS